MTKLVMTPVKRKVTGCVRKANSIQPIKANVFNAEEKELLSSISSFGHGIENVKVAKLLPIRITAGVQIIPESSHVVAKSRY